MKLHYNEGSNTFSDKYSGSSYHMNPNLTKTNWDKPSNKLFLGILAIVLFPLLPIALFIRWYFEQKKLNETLKKKNDSSKPKSWFMELGTSRIEVCSNCGLKNEIYADEKLRNKIFKNKIFKDESGEQEIPYLFKCSRCGSALKNILVNRWAPLVDFTHT